MLAFKAGALLLSCLTTCQVRQRFCCQLQYRYSDVYFLELIYEGGSKVR